MKSVFSLTAVLFVAMIFALSSCSTQDDRSAKPAAPAAAPAAKAQAKTDTSAAPAEKSAEKGAEKAEKAKTTKVSGDVGLLDTEKNYLIIVTKDGKLITIDFDPKTPATQIEPTPAKIADVGLGSSAVVEYTKEGEKSLAKSIEFKPAKGGD